MADGNIRIAIEVDGKQVELASKDLDELAKSGQTSGKGVKEAEDGLKGVGKESEKASGSVKKFATALGLVAIGAAAFAVLKSSLDDAISRFDTLNKFPKVLQELGVSAEQSEKAMQRLSDGTDGLPTKLDEIASTAQRMYSSFSDMDLATESAIALNNALLGSGSSAEQASRGTEMYLKALQTGQIDMQTWRSLSETMDVGLIKIGESFGYAADTAKNDLYQALKSGEISMTEFNEKLIEVGTGTGVMAKLAKENSLGLATSLTNLKTAVSRNLANIIQSFDKLSKEVTGKDIAQNIDSLKNVINAAFKNIQKVIEGSTPYVKAFARAVKDTIPVVRFLSPAILGLMAAYGAYTVISKTTAIIQASHAVITAAIASSKGLTLATIASTSASTADTVAKAAQSGAVSLSTLVIGTLTGAISLSTAAQTVATAATYAWGAAIKFLTGPVGIAVTVIGLLVAGTIALVKWFNKSTEAGRKLEKETDELVSSSKKLADTSTQNAKAFKEQQDEMKKTSKEHKEMVRQVDELSKKENKSAADKHRLASYVDMLNESVDGLNVSYNEQSDKLSMTSDDMREHVELLAAQTSYNDALERQVEIAAEQQEIDLRLGEINKLREETNASYERGETSSKKANIAIQELNEEEERLKNTNADLGEQYTSTTTILEGSMNTIVEATKNGVAGQIESYEELEDHQKAAFDTIEERYNQLADAATNAFERINDESAVTIEEIFDNQQHNLEQTEKYGENIARLYEHAGKSSNDNFIEWLNTLSIDSAAEVAVMASMTDKELDKYVKLFDEQMEAAADATHKSLGKGLEESVDTVIDFVDKTKSTMEQEIKSANFDSAGEDVADGFSDGVKDGTPKAEDAVINLAEKVEEALRKQLEIHSPSRVFKRIGEDGTDGITLGISSGTVTVINATKALAVNMIKQFVNTRSNFIGIGSSAMQGLNAGLNAGSGQVMNTARRIANNVAATMKRALDINSPSYVMRDEVGKMIPAGIAVGIEDNADSVFKTIKAMGTTMIDVAKPEVALGAFADAGLRGNTSNTNSVVNNIVNNNNNNDGAGVVEATLEIDGQSFAVVTAPYMSKEINNRNKNTARGRGVVRL